MDTDEKPVRAKRRVAPFVSSRTETDGSTIAPDTDNTNGADIPSLPTEEMAADNGNGAAVSRKKRGRPSSELYALFHPYSSLFQALPSLKHKNLTA